MLPCLSSLPATHKAPMVEKEKEKATWCIYLHCKLYVYYT